MPIFCVVDTLPKAIKIVAVVKESLVFPEWIRLIESVTSEHREMLALVLSLFEIQPDNDPYDDDRATARIVPSLLGKASI
jgi:UDP-N-acetylglucosamine 2-epimerase